MSGRRLIRSVAVPPVTRVFEISSTSSLTSLGEESIRVRPDSLRLRLDQEVPVVVLFDRRLVVGLHDLDPFERDGEEVSGYIRQVATVEGGRLRGQVSANPCQGPQYAVADVVPDGGAQPLDLRLPVLGQGVLEVLLRRDRHDVR